MQFTIVMPVLAALLFLGLLAMQALGRWTARRSSDADATRLGAIEGAVFGLLGLLLAFTFSGAASRFNDRRELIVQEANDAGTSYLRLDLVDEPARQTMKQELRDYVDARLATYQDSGDAAARQAAARATELQGRLWQAAITAVHAQPDITAMLLPPFNDLFDIASTRFAASSNHPPMIIYLMLVAITLACSFLAGFAFGPGQTRHRIATWAFAGVISIALYVVVDLEYPRYGFIRVDSADVFLSQARASMR